MKTFKDYCRVFGIRSNSEGLFECSECHGSGKIVDDGGYSDPILGHYVDCKICGGKRFGKQFEKEYREDFKRVKADFITKTKIKKQEEVDKIVLSCR